MNTPGPEDLGANSDDETSEFMSFCAEHCSSSDTLSAADQTAETSMTLKSSEIEAYALEAAATRDKRRFSNPSFTDPCSTHYPANIDSPQTIRSNLPRCSSTPLVHYSRVPKFYQQFNVASNIASSIQVIPESFDEFSQFHVKKKNELFPLTASMSAKCRLFLNKLKFLNVFKRNF